MTYSAIIFDLDGTAMPSGIDAMPSQKLIQITRKYSNTLNLCAATGRSWLHAKPIVKILELTHPCIISGGAMIIDPVNEKVLWQKTISSDITSKILTIARKFPYKVAIAQDLETSDKTDVEFVDTSGAVNTFYILDIPKGRVKELIIALEQIDGITISKALSWFAIDGFDLHITNHEATKEHAVAELCALLGVHSKDVAGVGDGFNDLHLFKAVGHKVAMGNAAKELKAVSDIVIDGIDKDGLAKFIIESAEI